VESAGVALTSTGGRLSLGPPEGGTMLAQPVPVLIASTATSRITVMEMKSFMTEAQT
jgi:hypothetical protein